jgi:hypothetical protein
MAITASDLMIEMMMNVVILNEFFRLCSCGAGALARAVLLGT